MVSLEQIREYLQNKKYQVIVELTEDGCILKTPQHIEKPIVVNPLLVRYKIDHNTLTCTMVNDEINDISTVSNVPQYAKRLAICVSFLKNCKLLNYHAEMIFYYDQDKKITNDQFFSSLPFTINDEDQILETYLNDLITLTISYGYSDKYEEIAKKYGILDGLNVIKKILIAEDNNE